MTTRTLFRFRNVWFWLFVLFLFLPLPAGAQWAFDWAIRTDRDGKPAGVYDQTPFPITESTVQYSIKSDEYPSGRTYSLGQRYFVDGLSGSDANSGVSFSSPKKTITSAIAAAGSGNKTIIIRGAHDSFNGVYYETINLNQPVRTGTDDTHRWMLVGYGQERPILDGNDGIEDIIGRNTAGAAFITIQRLKLQNTQTSGVRLGWDVTGDKRDGFFSCIDLWFYMCGNRTHDRTTDGSCYYLNVDNGWILHCTSEHTYGHAYKLGDGTSNNIAEWSVARYIGYWDGISSVFEQSACGFDYPVDTDARDAHDIICRYNVAHSIVNYALQVRRVRNFDVHHNEFYDAIHHDEVDPQGHQTLGKYMIILYAGQTSGDFHSNIVRDSSNPGTISLLVAGVNTNSPTIRIYNNLFYGSTGAAISLGLDNSGAIGIYNNSFYANNSDCLIENRTGATPELMNNILYQAGTGACLINRWVASLIHHDNLYFAPNGSVGVSLQTSEISGNPRWLAIPNGVYNTTFAYLTAGSPALDRAKGLSSLFAVDLLGILRTGAWDLGAVELGGQPPHQPPLQPSNLRIKSP
jgi:hypothetical protein